MTVKELKELLADKPDDAIVEVGFFSTGDESGGWYESDATEVILSNETGPIRQVVTIR